MLQSIPFFIFILMISLATGHFPNIIREKNKTWLFNPVLKKRFSNRPEERVRLNWVEYLIRQTGWKKTRIGFEAPVTLHREGSTLRADLILYNQEMEPYVLVECKSESVSLTPTVAEQAARYNSRVQAPFLVLTNGVQDYWYIQQNGTVKPADPPFEQVQSLDDVYKAKDYWQDRGFYSAGSSPGLKNRLNGALELFWSKGSPSEKRFLNFKDSFLSFGMNHYYRIIAVDNEIKLAIGFLGTSGAGSFLVGVLNRKGVNAGVVTINLDVLENGEKASAALYYGNKPSLQDARKILPDSFLDFMPAVIEKLPLFLMRFFD